MSGNGIVPFQDNLKASLEPRGIEFFPRQQKVYATGNCSAGHYGHHITYLHRGKKWKKERKL